MLRFNGKTMTRQVASEKLWARKIVGRGGTLNNGGPWEKGSFVAERGRDAGAESHGPIST